MQNISTKLRELRERMNLSEAEFAKKIGSKQQNVHNYEKGTRVPIEHVNRIIKAFGFDWNSFVSGSVNDLLQSTTNVVRSPQAEHTPNETNPTHLTDLERELINAKAEARIYREIVDKYFGRLVLSLDKIENIALSTSQQEKPSRALNDIRNNKKTTGVERASQR
jgi:transcriptional regulator with XRE-family HTH domain